MQSLRSQIVWLISSHPVGQKLIADPELRKYVELTVFLVVGIVIYFHLPERLIKLELQYFQLFATLGVCCLIPGNRNQAYKLYLERHKPNPIGDVDSTYWTLQLASNTAWGMYFLSLASGPDWPNWGIRLVIVFVGLFVLGFIQRAQKSGLMVWMIVVIALPWVGSIISLSSVPIFSMVTIWHQDSWVLFLIQTFLGLIAFSISITSVTYGFGKQIRKNIRAFATTGKLEAVSRYQFGTQAFWLWTTLVYLLAWWVSIGFWQGLMEVFFLFVPTLIGAIMNVALLLTASNSGIQLLERLIHPRFFRFLASE